MNNKKIYLFGLPVLLLMGSAFVYHETKNPDALFYQSATTGTLVEIGEDSTETVVSTTTQTSSAKENATMIDLERELSTAISEEFEVECVVSIGNKMRGDMSMTNLYIHIDDAHLQTPVNLESVEELAFHINPEWDTMQIESTFPMSQPLSDSEDSELPIMFDFITIDIKPSPNGSTGYFFLDIGDVKNDYLYQNVEESFHAPLYTPSTEVKLQEHSLYFNQEDRVEKNRTPYSKESDSFYQATYEVTQGKFTYKNKIFPYQVKIKGIIGTSEVEAMVYTTDEEISFHEIIRAPMRRGLVGGGSSIYDQVYFESRAVLLNASVSQVEVN